MTCLCVFFVSIKTAACSFSILDIIQNNKKQESIVIVYLYNDELKTMNLNQFTTNSKWNHFKRRRTPIDDCVSMLSLATNAANSVFICYHRKRLGINFEIGGGEDTKTLSNRQLLLTQWKQFSEHFRVNIFDRIAGKHYRKANFAQA